MTSMTDSCLYTSPAQRDPHLNTNPENAVPTRPTAAAYATNLPLKALLGAATPVIRIDGIRRETWRGRDRDNMSDFRLGPWRVPEGPSWTLVSTARAARCSTS